MYSDLGKSQVVHTAWALLALLSAKWHTKDPSSVGRAAAYLVSAQQESGDWPQEPIVGVFNRKCMISYSNYRCSS